MADYDDLPYIVVERRSAGVTPFLWGALIGAGVALLLAPKSGKETRRDIRQGVDRLRNTAEDTVRQVQQTLSGTIEDLRDQVTEGIDSARRAMDAGREAARKARADLERRVREAEMARETAYATTTDGGGEERLTEVEEMETDEYLS